MIISRLAESIRKADFGTLLLEMFILVAGILLALAVDRWNQDRVDAIETGRIVERLKSDTARNLQMFEATLPAMEQTLSNVKVFTCDCRNRSIEDFFLTSGRTYLLITNIEVTLVIHTSVDVDTTTLLD